MSKQTPLSITRLIQRCAELGRKGAFDEAEKIYREALAQSPFEEELYFGYALLKRDADERDEASLLAGFCLRQCGRSRDVLALKARLELERGFDAIDQYQDALFEAPDDAELVLGLAEAQLAAGSVNEAIAGLARVLQKRPLWIEGHVALAKVRWEYCGDDRFDAIDQYQDALFEVPDDAELVLGLAEAQLAAGSVNEAIAGLVRVLQKRPLWIEGHVALAKVRWEYCGDDRFDAAFRDAIWRYPDNRELHFGYCGMLSSALFYDKVLTAVSRARTAIGLHPMLDMFEAQARSELRQDALAEKLFRSLGPVEDPSFAAIRMRSLLMTARPDEAAALGERFLSHPMASFIWPLLGLAWRETNDERWEWLNGFHDSVSIVDLPIPVTQLAALADRLRQLHSSQQYPMDLSARGGTQTRLNLLERSDPELASLRRLLRDAVRTYVDGLPAHDASHPFLSRPRGPFRFAGSWSIRLRDAGHHVAHTHPSGWISSALYIALPAELDHDRQEGWLALGGSPPELGLSHDAVRQIQPQPARLVLFPSIMWHETLPFKTGERLTVAFDIVPLGG